MKDDPLGGTQAGFMATARMIANAGLPAEIMQEGGDLREALPRNLVAYSAVRTEAT